VATSQIVQFLEAIDAELVNWAGDGERLAFFLIGRAALILRYGLSLATKDVDMVSRMGSLELERKALELFGKGTPNAMTWNGRELPPTPLVWTRKKTRAVNGSTRASVK